MANFSKEDIEKNKGFAALVIFPVCFIFYFISGSSSEYVRHCANQGIIFTVCFLVISVASWLLTWIPILGAVLSLIFKIIDLLLLLVVIVQMIRAAKGTI